MVDSASDTTKNSGKGLYNFSEESNRNVVEKLVNELQAEGSLSEAEIKFLSQSKEKRNSVQLLDSIISSEISIQDYEDVLYLKNYTAFGGTINPEQKVRNIRYKDSSGSIVATLQIDTLSKKIRMQNFGNILPKIECFTPFEVGMKIQKLAKFNNWSTEDGGVNRFNGNTEVRYKDGKGNVMAAVIKKEDGTFDTVVEYEYNTDYRTKMILTNVYGNSIVIYDGTSQVNQTVRIDIDNDGTIVEITKIYLD